MSENQVMVVTYDDGTENMPWEGRRTLIQRAAFSHRDSSDEIFEGFICNTDEEIAEILGDYSWEEVMTFEDGKTLWRNLNKEMVENTASVLGLDIEFPKHSLVYLVD